jgi:phage replication-related protein YjqB (UPF0714/DUF867 family)
VDLAQLLSIFGVVEECELRSNVGIMALHGGSQDRGTDMIARQAAERAGASFYAIVQPEGLRVHITSRHHDPELSPTLANFLRHVSLAISVHGFGRDALTLWLDPTTGPIIEPYGPALRGTQTGPLRGIIIGGRNAELVDEARRLFAYHLSDFHVADERLRLGYHPENPVNLPSRHGVQIELAPGLRGIGPFGEHLSPQRDEVTDRVIDTLVVLTDRAQEMLSRAPGESE